MSLSAGFFLFFLLLLRTGFPSFIFILVVAAIDLSFISSVSVFFLSPSFAMSSGPLTFFSTGSLVLKDLDKEYTPASTDASATVTAKQKVKERVGDWRIERRKNSRLLFQTAFSTPHCSSFSLSVVLGTREFVPGSCRGSRGGTENRLPPTLKEEGAIDCRSIGG